MELNKISDYSTKIKKIFESAKSKGGVDYRKLLAYLPFRSTKDTAEFIFQLSVDDILNGISNELEFLKWILDCNFLAFDYSITPEIKTCKDNVEFLIAGIKNKDISGKTDVIIISLKDLENSVERRKFWKANFANLFTIDMSSDVIINACTSTNYKTMFESLSSKYTLKHTTMWWGERLRIENLTSNDSFNKDTIYTSKELYNDRTNSQYPLLKLSKMDMADTNKIKNKYKSIVKQNGLSVQEFKYLISVLDSETLDFLKSKKVLDKNGEINNDIVETIRILAFD